MNEQCAQVGSYAVDALDPAERAVFEAHLAGCPSCQAEMAGFREAVASLSETVAVAPPPSVRAQVLDQIRQVRPLPPVRLNAVSSPVNELDRARVARHARPTPWSAGRATRGLLVAAAAAVLGLGSLSAATFHQSRVNERQHQAIDQAIASQNRQESSLLLAADLKVVPVSFKGAGNGAYFISSEQDLAMLVVTSLPDPGAGQTYEMWTFHSGRPVRNVLFGATGTQRILFTGVKGAHGVAVTKERSAGSDAPTGDPLAEAKF